MNNLIKTGVIGLGIGERHARIYASNPKTELTSICDFEKNKLEEIGLKFPDSHKTTDYKEIINDKQIKLVSIASYDNYHASQVIDCLKMKKHVFVEKPICLNEIELNSIIEMLKQNQNIHLSSNFILRSFPIFKELKNKIQAGGLGEIYYIEGDYNYGRLNKITESWRGKIPFYSVTHGGGMHLIDIMTWLLGKKVKSVVSTGNQICSKNTEFKYLDLVSSLLKFEDDVVGKVSSNFGCVTNHHHCIRVYGTKGTFLYTNQGISYSYSRDASLGTNDTIPFDKLSYDKSEVLNSFIDEIAGGPPAMISKKEVVSNMLISLAIEQSLSSNKWENIDYSDCSCI